MASVSQQRRRRQGSFESQRQPAYRPQKRRWLKRLVICFTLLAVFVLALPTVVAYTGLRNAPLRLALRDIHGTVEAGGASLSWFGPICYTDLQIRNERGEVLLSLAKVESERSLFGLLSNLKDLGTFRIERPQVSLALRPDGSNLEDVLAPMLTSEKPSTDPAGPPSKPPAMAIEIVDGNIKVLDTATGQRWELDKFNFKLRMSPESTLPAEMALSGEVPFEGHTAKLAITGTPAASGAQEHVDVKIDALPLAMFRPLADRFAPDLQLAGSLSTDLHCDGIDGNPASPMKVTGMLALDQVTATGGPLGTDRLALHRIELPCKLAYQNRRLDVDQLGISCDVGQIGIAGSVTIPEKIGGDTLTQFARSALNVNGQLDLAKLAALLPGTLHVRQGTQITSGHVQLALASKPDAGGQVWTGRLIASDLAAIDSGRRLAWDQPIDLQLAAREQTGNYSIDQFSCVSSFMKLTGRGSLDQFHAEAECDLDRLMSELSQFIDLGTIRLAGRGDARLDWQRPANGTFQTAADAKFLGLQVALPGKPAWQDDSVVLNANAAGNLENLTLATLTSANLRRLDAAQFTATIDNAATQAHEQINLRLLQPVDGLAANSRWPLDVHVQGQLTRWWPRMASWLALDGLDLGGACDIAAQVAYSPAGVEIQQVKANFNDLHAWGWNTLFIDEPGVQLEASGGYEFATGRLTLNRSTLLTSSISLRTEAATVSMPSGGPFSMQGQLSYRADLARLFHWISDPRTSPSYAMAGLLTGSADVAHNGSVTTGRFDSAIDNFAVYVFDDSAAKPRSGLRQNAPARAPDPIWQEARLTLAAGGSFDSAAETIQLAGLQVGSQALAMQAAGKIAQLKTQQNLDLSGVINYDWQTLGPLLKPYLGSHIAIAGRQSNKFSIHGPLGTAGKDLTLVSATANPAAAARPQIDRRTGQPIPDPFASLRSLVADAAFGWQQAEINGLYIGPLTFDAHLENGIVALKPIDTIIGAGRNPGRLTVAPIVQLSPGPAQIVLNKGPLLTDVPITDQLADSWLKFVAPMVAEATRTEGVMSVELDGVRVPISDPKQADLGGRLIVQNMTVTPGPLFRPFVLIGRQVEAMAKGKLVPQDLGRDPALLKIDNQKVDFHLVEGRVFHQGLTMEVGEVTIRTRGWVGLDETVNIVAEIPVKDEWKKQRNSPLAGFTEDVIRVPIQGNLKNPKFEFSVLTKLLETLPRAAIENAVNKGLERLFNPPQR